MAKLATTKIHTYNNGQFQGNFFIDSSDGKEYHHEEVMPGLRDDIQTAELGLGRGDEARHSGQQSRLHNSNCGQYSASSNHPFMRDSSGVEYWIDTGHSPSTLNVHRAPYTCKYTYPSERSSGQADIDQMLLNDLLNDSGVQFDYASSLSKQKQKDCSSPDDEYMQKNTERSTKKNDKPRNKFFIDSTEILKIRDVSNEKHGTTVKDENERNKDNNNRDVRWIQNNNGTNVSLVSSLPANKINNKNIFVNSLTTKLENNISQAEKSSDSSSLCNFFLKQEAAKKKGVKRNNKDSSARSKKEKLSIKVLNTVKSKKPDMETPRANTTQNVPETENNIQHCKRYESGDYDDDSDFSVLTANYIRSTKVSKGNNSRQSKSFLRSINVMDREASTKSLILHANKSTETSTDFALDPFTFKNPDIGPAGRTRAALYKNLHYKNEEVLVKAGLLKYTCSEDVRHIGSQKPNQCLNVYPVSQQKCESDSKTFNYSTSGNNKKDLNLFKNNKVLGTKEHSASDDSSSSVIVVERKSLNIKKSKEITNNTNNVNIESVQSNCNQKKIHHRAMCSVGCITDDTILINEKIMQATLEVQKQDIDNLIDITKNALKSLRKSGTSNSNKNCPQWTKNRDEEQVQVSSHEKHKLNKRKKSGTMREKSYALRFAASDDSQSLVTNQNTSIPHGKSQVKYVPSHSPKQKQKKRFLK